MTDKNRDIEAQRLLNAIMDASPRDEPLHEENCFECEVASEVVGSLGAYWDVNDIWWNEGTVVNSSTRSDWPPEMTRAEQAEKIVAHVLHRRLRKQHLYRRLYLWLMRKDKS